VVGVVSVVVVVLTISTQFAFDIAERTRNLQKKRVRKQLNEPVMCYTTFFILKKKNDYQQQSHKIQNTWFVFVK
jgi:hypothetical protein